MEPESQGTQHHEHGVKLGDGADPHGLVEAFATLASLLGDLSHPVGTGHLAHYAHDLFQLARSMAAYLVAQGSHLCGHRQVHFLAVVGDPGVERRRSSLLMYDVIPQDNFSD